MTNSLPSWPRNLLLLTCVCTLSPIAHADDWPQWLGPRRDGVWREMDLLTAFPKEGLVVRWRAPVGGGYSGPAVANGHVFVTDRILKPGAERPADPFQRITQAGSERVLCLEESTGKLLWSHEYDCPYSVSYSSGPRTTPAVDGDRVYTLGAEGDLLCLEVATGKVVWSKHLSSERSPTPMWGFAGHPLVDGNKLIVLTCGTDPAGGDGLVTAFDKKTGVLIWSAFSEKESGYSAPMIYQAGEAGAARQLIVWSPQMLHSLNPETGKVYWAQPFGPVRYGVSIVTPRFYRDPGLGDLLFVATQYEGSLVLKLDPAEPKASVFWKRGGKSDRKTDALHILMAAPTLRDGHVYGVCAQGELRCLNLANGDRLWSTFDATTYDAGQQKWATAFIIPLGDTGTRYLIANEHGDLILADLDPSGYHEVSRTHLLEPTNTDPHRPVVWSHPAFANHSVYWRNDRELICASMTATRNDRQVSSPHP